MKNRITKAVFPVAGLGTRFLPATKASPKEMLPIVDKPLIQYAVEEAIEAGIDQMIFVTGRSKRAIADHFDKGTFPMDLIPRLAQLELFGLHVKGYGCQEKNHTSYGLVCQELGRCDSGLRALFSGS